MGESITAYRVGPGGVRIMRGTVKWFSDQKGYGFITGQDGKDVFVHRSAIAEAGLRTLTEGQEVEFDPVQGPKGLQAAHIRPLQPAQ